MRRVAGRMSALAVLSVILGCLGTATAQAKAPNLDGETFNASSATLVASPTGGDPYCGATQQGSVQFSATGTASGPYPGTFTETGHWDFDLIVEQTFSASFQIVSGGRTIRGVVSYEEGAAGAEGTSLLADYGSCTGSQSGGPYSTCESESFAGSCGGQAVVIVDSEGLSQTFEHPTGKFHMTIVEGDEQLGHLNAEFEQPLVVRVTDSLGAPVGGAYVTFKAPKRNPTATPQGPSTGTEWDGYASMPVFAGPSEGTYAVTAKAPKGAKATFTLTNAP